MKLLITAIALMVTTGCASNLTYAPKQIGSIESSIKIIELALYEQPPRYAPFDFEVNGRYMEIIRGRVTPFTHATSKVHIEYQSIGKVTLHSKRSWFIVQIFDKNETVRYRVYSKNKSQMQGVIDAIYTLKSNLTPETYAPT